MSGWVIWRDKEELPDDLIFHVNYLGGDMPVFQLNFSRPAGQIVAQYYDFLRLGHEGYRRVSTWRRTTPASTWPPIIPELGPFELLCDSNPSTGIPTVTWRIREGEDPGYTLFDLADRLRMSGWQVPAYTLTGTASDIPVQRILVRQGVSRDLASLLLDDMRDAISPLRQAPGHRLDDQGGVERLQPPLAGLPTFPTSSRSRGRICAPGAHFRPQKFVGGA